MRILAIRGKNLASLRGEFEIALNKPPLEQAGLFAITGHTGAGKSTLLDAMCLGVPVVTTEKCGCPDLFENGEIGIRVKPKDSHLLAEAIIKLFNDYELCKKFSRAGINKRDDYDYNKIAKEYLNLYEEYS